MAILSITTLLPLQPTYRLLSFPVQTKLNNFTLNFGTNLYYNYPVTTYPNRARAAPIFTASSNVDVSTSTTLSVTGWTEFVKNVSGEWDGFGADFTKGGTPIELPESVVPEAYREWEVKVFDWQTQCPTLAQPHEFSLMYKNIKLLPTVGCEADAATRYSIDERNVTNNEQSPVLAFAYQSSGCYVAVWPVADHDSDKLLELEYCLIDPRDKESRVRIIQVIRIEDSKLELQNIKVFVEQWYGPFRNGDQLGGCSIRDSAFAVTQPLKPSQVTGVWQGLNAVATFNNSQTIILQLRDESVRQTVRDERSLVLLPKQLWCSLREEENEETFCEVGWLLDEGRTITSKCIFSSQAELKEIAIASEEVAG
ncbi:Hypothetical predicted protein [Olea europaea subsp. europaea]|uniref:Uncharacterized protein n=1 Tax=Olea europaea subsp. europaea TaxID=158383 RepID=A0A8S0RE82_OLEEU|nr:Hypothetical predicted protein [Olea europaea subsp. europaea]